MIKIIIRNAITQKNTPMTDASIKGTVEKAVIPSREYKNNFQKFHFVSPLARSTFSYSSHLVRNPTHPKMPLVNLLYSFIAMMASTICLVISR